MRRLRRALLRSARAIAPAMRRWRREFHRHPELTDHEFGTRDRVVRFLREIGLSSQTYRNFAGVRSSIRGPTAGVVVALRADMDALPVTEPITHRYRSENPGTMHACGHDVHMACLLGAAHLLRERHRSLRGEVRLLFQPAEEQGERGGALPFLRRGALDRPKADFIVGQHVQPEVPLGIVEWKAGPMMAAADRFRLRIHGTPGHAGYPERGADAVLAAAEVITSLQSLVSRSKEAFDPVVITVGQVHGGTRHNVLPAEVVLEGTLRTFRPSTRASMEERLKRRIRLVAESTGAKASVEWYPGYPVLVNDARVTATVAEGLRSAFGANRVREFEGLMMGAEDFSRYLERVPGTFLRLGVGGEGAGGNLHSPEFFPPEEALVYGAAALAASALALQGVAT